MSQEIRQWGWMPQDQTNGCFKIREEMGESGTKEGLNKGGQEGSGHILCMKNSGHSLLYVIPGGQGKL